VKSGPRKSAVAGVLLIAIALLVMASAALYVVFAPRVFSSQATVSIVSAPPQNRPMRIEELPLQSFAHDRNLVLRQARNSALVQVDYFAADPETAATRVNECVQQLREAVQARRQGSFSVLAMAQPNPRPVRPNKQKILSIAAIVSMNLGVAGVTCLIVGFLNKRREISAEQTPLPAQI
jgi:uncharacterized protein involved in exopolysaccharide biosynthesis